MIPDAIFLELSTAFGKPSAAEVELLQEQQRALYEGGSESKALIELAIEGGFLTPAEAEKFVRLAKLQDVGAPTPPAKAPSERTRAKAPSERARTKAPSERTRTKAPSERARTKAPSERARTRGPSERVERSASGRHATGSSTPLAATLVAGLVFACLGLAYVFTRPPASKPQVASDEDEGPRTAEEYLELARDVRRATLERLDRGQGEKAMTALRARIHEWSQIPAAAAAVLELDLLRSELADALEARKTPTSEEELAGPEEIPHANRFPVDPEETPEEAVSPPQAGKDPDAGPRVVVQRPKPPPRRSPPAKPPAQPPSEPEAAPKNAGASQTDGSSELLLGSLEALRERGLSPDYLERLDALKPDDVGGRLRLAKWARRNHLFAEERFALKSVLKIDGDNRSAGKQLDELVREELEHRDFHTPWRVEGSVLFFETNTSEAKLYLYSQAVNAFYARYSKIFKVRKTPLQRWGVKIGVRIFATRADFERYQKETGSSLGESAVGYYSLDRKELVLYDDPNDPQETHDTLYHEGTHLFTHLALGEQAYALPPWILEGIAEYFGASAYDPAADELEIGRPSYMRLRAAKRRVKAGQASLRGDLLEADFGNYRSDNYALGWALIHMLLEATKPGSGKPLYAKGFLRCFEAVAKGENSSAAFERCVGPIPEFERLWQAYITEFPVPAYEEGLAFARAREHDEAIPLFERHLQDFPRDARAAFQLGESRYALDQNRKAIVAYREAIRLNHDYLDAYEGLTFALVAEGYPDKAVEAAQDGFDRHPSPRAHYALAWALHNAGRNPEALEAIREAISLDPRAPDYVALRDTIKAAMR